MLFSTLHLQLFYKRAVKSSKKKGKFVEKREISILGKVLNISAKYVIYACKSGVIKSIKKCRQWDLNPHALAGSRF